jgi:hypothetical protein
VSTLALLVVFGARPLPAQARECGRDSVKTRIGALAVRPGAIVEAKYEPLASLVNGTMSVRLERWTVRDMERSLELKGLAVLVRGGAQLHRSLLDAQEVPQLQKALATFERERIAGTLTNDQRQSYTTVDGLQIETFWDGSQRTVAVASGGSCPVSVYLDADALGRLRDGIGLFGP